MDFGTLLRAGGVLRVVLALGGRYRAALWVSLAIGLGWLLLGCAAPADAAALGPAIVHRPDPINVGPVGGYLAVAVPGAVAYFFWRYVLVPRSRHRELLDRDAVHGGADDGVPGARPGWLRPAGGPYFRAARDDVGS